MGLNEVRKLKEQSRLPKQPKQRKPIPKKSAKKLKQEAEEKALNKSKGGSDQERWYKDRRKEMSGYCDHCKDKSCKHQDNWYHCSIAHLLPKNLFKSIATHPLNWIELCFWDHNCHAQFDQFKLDITDLHCFNLVIERFIAMYPDIDPKERRYIPDSLLQYIKNETDL